MSAASTGGAGDETFETERFIPFSDWLGTAAPSLADDISRVGSSLAYPEGARISCIGIPIPFSLLPH
jgi:hypothetical protein